MENLIQPTSELMKSWFKEFNAEFFNNILPEIPFQAISLNSCIWGCFYGGNRSYYKRNRQWVDDEPTLCGTRICLNKNFIGTEYNLKNTFLHELVHYYIFYTYKYNPGRNHGKEFLYEAEKINKVSNWTITPTNDYAENELSEEGMKKFKSRIADEYIIGIYKFIDKHEKPYRAFLTKEKYMQATYNTCSSFSKESTPVFFKIKVKNNAIATRKINRGNYITSFATGNTIEETLEEVSKLYTITDCKEYNFIDKPKHETCYLVKLVDVDNDKYWVAKINDPKYYDKFKKKYHNLDASISVVYSYNDDFARLEYSKRSYNTVAYSTSDNDLDEILHDKYELSNLIYSK